jgi:hypothetical protein
MGKDQENTHVIIKMPKDIAEHLMNMFLNNNEMLLRCIALGIDINEVEAVTEVEVGDGENNFVNEYHVKQF